MELVKALVLASFCIAGGVVAQNGDHAGEIQTQTVDPSLIPPAPVLSPDEAMKHFQIVPGFSIELVASEPLIHDPVAMTFDPDGRIWVVEMIGFMRNPDGKHEEEPVGRIVVLEDTDGDGKMDKRTVFLDRLVMPRALALVRDGLLVAEPPHLWFCRDTNGDGVSDEKEEIFATYGDQRNPEHNANGLMWALDNWIYSANFTTRFRNINGDWEHQPTVFRGQWGISQDNYGRLVYNSNSDQFRIDLVPSHYLGRNPNYRTPIGINVDPIRNQKTYPIRVTPGVNRGYQKGMLRPDGKLNEFTAACGPVIYRGSNFPEEYLGNAFVCEPSANLIKRNILTDVDGVLSGHQAYKDSEFLASTDERFRPVNAYNGPDGALYLVDMYHGIIQHRVYLTTYLRNQSLSRGLEQPTGLGRIYRIVRAGTHPSARPHLGKAPSELLVQALSSADGWIRDTAQRLLIERNDPKSLPFIRNMAVRGPSPLGRIHALWTLEGLEDLDAPTVTAAMGDVEAKVRAAAIRVGEELLKTQDRKAAERAILGRLEDSQPDVVLQLAFSLGEINSPEADAALMQIGKSWSTNALIVEAIETSLGSRELESIEHSVKSSEWSENSHGRAKLLQGLARCVFVEGKTNRVDTLLRVSASSESWQRKALVDGIISTAPTQTKGRAARPIKPIRFAAEPEGWRALTVLDDDQTKPQTATLAKLITWPGQPGYVPPPYVRPLTETEQSRFDAGKALYTSSCAVCHQPNGLGQEGLAPPLAGSEWVIGPAARTIRIVLHGARGRINVEGRAYELEMPSLGGTFTDEQIASILTYVRREWENGADPVSTEGVANIRGSTATRQEGWSEEELLRIN